MILKIITFNVAHGRGMDGKVDLQRQAEVIKEHKENDVDISYYDNLVNEAIETISTYGDYEWFVS